MKGSTIEWSPESRIPFGTFPIRKLQAVQNPSPQTFPRSLLHGTPLKDEEAFLFQHYVHHVAFLMMPYEDQRNPWKSTYPAVALYYVSQNHKSLYKALLAQAAYNLAYLDCGRDRMLSLAATYYSSAMRDLRHGLLDQDKDYGNFVASIMTLVMVEVCSANFKTFLSLKAGRFTAVIRIPGVYTSRAHGSFQNNYKRSSLGIVRHLPNLPPKVFA